MRLITINADNISIGKYGDLDTGDQVSVSDEVYAELVEAGRIADGTITDDGEILIGQPITTDESGKIPESALPARLSEGNVSGLVNSAVEDATSAHLSGKEMAFASTTAIFSTNNTAVASVAATSLVTGLVVTVTGDGQPVEVDFTGLVDKNGGTGIVGAYLVMSKNGGPDTAQGSESGTFAGAHVAFAGSQVTLNLKRRLVLEDGVSYTFKIGINQTTGAARVVGYSTPGTAYSPAHLKVTHL